MRRTDQHVNFGRFLGDGVKENEVSARWTGYFTPSAPGDYVLFVQGPGEEGGSRVYLDDKLVIDNWEQAYARLSQVHMYNSRRGRTRSASNISCMGLGAART